MIVNEQINYRFSVLLYDTFTKKKGNKQTSVYNTPKIIHVYSYWNLYSPNHQIELNVRVHKLIIIYTES